ncbi:MAG: hypothetical protein ABW097_19085 [Candidatus Thiodiazotropha lotti]
MSEEIEKQRLRCEARNISFVPLDQDRISLILKDHPDLVDDFFSRSWVEAFNGRDAMASLSGRKLNRENKLKARDFIKTLYTTHFKTIDGGIPAAAPVFRGAIQPMPVIDRYVEPNIEIVESIIEQEQAATSKPQAEHRKSSQDVPTKSFQRREIRTKLALSAGLATTNCFLLLGGAGFGKSAALRVIIYSLLSGGSHFPALAKSWGQRLPLLLPFGFLTQHFVENYTPTVEGALKAWLMVLGAKNDVLSLLEEMLGDERLLLFVDGLDEWQNREAAVTAFTALTTYAQARSLPLVATGRPLGIERISDFGPEWRRANLLPLNADQQLTFSSYWFRHFHRTEAILDAIALEQAVTRDSEGFAEELSEDPTLSELGGVPLLLSVLIYLRLIGRVLPRSRLDVLEELIKALLEDQPHRRAQASMQRIDQSIVRSRRIRHGIEYLAYCIHQEPNSIDVPYVHAMELLVDYFHTNCALTASESDDWAERVLELGQREFGILVSPQESHIGVLHRIFQEYLAAKHLARLPFNQIKNYCGNTGRKSPWHEITLLLMQLLERQNEVDELIDDLSKPVVDSLEESLQQVLLTRVAVTEINSSNKKARDLLSQVFSWIEYGRWMPLRRTIVGEVVAGLESERLAPLISGRANRWFPGRLKWLYDIPTAAVKQPTSETVFDLKLALHNCTSEYVYRSIAESLALFSKQYPNLADDFLEILRGPAEPEIMGAALHALVTGWPSHNAVPALLQKMSESPAIQLRQVAVLARFNRGERSAEIRDAIIDLHKEWPWPWDKDVIVALSSGWPHDPQLKNVAIKSVQGIRDSQSWDSKFAIEYLLRGCPKDNDVAHILAEKLSTESGGQRELRIFDIYEELIDGFSHHPLLIPAAESWLDMNMENYQEPLEYAAIAKLGGTEKCRQALLEWLRKEKSTPAWIISTLLKMSKDDDVEVQEVLKNYVSDDARLSMAVRYLPDIISDQQELGIMLRKVLHSDNVHYSCSALAILVEKEGRDSPDLWSMVEAKLHNDKSGHYWSNSFHTIVEIWPEKPLIRKMVKSSIYNQDLSISLLYEIYANDPEIRPLLDGTMHVLHEDLRIEFVRAIEPLVQGGVQAAIDIVADFSNEPNAEARTIAARACAHACVRNGSKAQSLIDALNSDLIDISIDEQPKQAAAAALLKLGRADLFNQLARDDQPLELRTYSGSRHNWEFVATVVDYWEPLIENVPDIWERLDHSPIITLELTKAGKGNYSREQVHVYENSIRAREQLEEEEVRAIIAFHGRSTYLRDLFLDRLNYMKNKSSIMHLEQAAYTEIASYLTEHFHHEEEVGNTLLSLADSSLIRDVAVIALCQGWPDSPKIKKIAEDLPKLIDDSEPVTAWLFALNADSELMARYVMRYPSNFLKNYYGRSKAGISAIRDRLKTDQKCQNILFSELHNNTDLVTRIALVKLLAPTMRKNTVFRAWVSDQIQNTRKNSQDVCQLVIDVFDNKCKPVEFALLEAVFTRY